MHKKNIFLILFSLFFATDVRAGGMDTNSASNLCGRYSITAVVIGSLSASYIICSYALFNSGFNVEEEREEDIEFQQDKLEVEQQESSRLGRVFSMLCKGILVGIAAIGMWSTLQSDGVQAVEYKPSPLMIGNVEDVDLARYIQKPEDIVESFDDLAALPSSLQVIVNDVRHGGAPPKGMLFFGEPGVGKSHSSKALAKAYNALLFRIPGYEFTGNGVDFSRRLFKLIDRIKKEDASEHHSRPIFLVIDEAEVFGIRSKLGFSETQLDLGGSIRALMDYTEQKDSGVTCIFTTNHPELIDCALKRPGRVGEHIEFKIPNKDERSSIIKLHAKKKNVSFSTDALREIVAQSEGWTGDYLAKCVEKCGRGSSGLTVQAVKAKQAAFEVAQLWLSNQEERRVQSGSRWMRLLKFGTSSAVSAVTGNIGSAVSHGVDAVGSLFEE